MTDRIISHYGSWKNLTGWHGVYDFSRDLSSIDSTRSNRKADLDFLTPAP